MAPGGSAPPSRITVPMIRDNIRTAYVYLGILALDAFVYMQALNPSGGPANSTVVISQHLLNTAFKKGKFGYADLDGRDAGDHHAGLCGAGVLRLLVDRSSGQVRDGQRRRRRPRFAPRSGPDAAKPVAQLERPAGDARPSGPTRPSPPSRMSR